VDLLAEPVTAVQPLDLARRQHSPEGRRQSESVLRSWEPQLRRIPAQRFAPSNDPRQPRFWEVTFLSVAMHRAVSAIAYRHRISSSPVLLAALAVTLVRLTGNDPFAVQLMVSNRFRPGVAETVSPMSQGSLCVIDVTDSPFDDVVRRANDAAMKAYLGAYYDPVHLDEMVQRISEERGEELDLSCFFNDRRFSTTRPDAVDEEPELTDLRDLTAQTSIEVGVQMDRWNEKFFLHVDDVPDVTKLFLCVDTNYFAPADISRLLLGMESVVVEAALAVPIGS
jgi:hypothetical protein